MGTVLFMHKPFVLIRKHSLFRPVAAAGSILLFVLAVFNPPNWFYVLSAIVLLLMLYFLWRQNRGIPIIFHTDGKIFVGKKPYSLTLGEFKGVASAFCRCGQTNFCLRIALIPKNVCHPVLIVQEFPMSQWRGAVFRSLLQRSLITYGQNLLIAWIYKTSDFSALWETMNGTLP